MGATKGCGVGYIVQFRNLTEAIHWTWGKVVTLYLEPVYVNIILSIIYIYVCIYTYIHIYIYINLHIYICTYIYICIYQVKTHPKPMCINMYLY